MQGNNIYTRSKVGHKYKEDVKARGKAQTTKKFDAIIKMFLTACLFQENVYSFISVIWLTLF